MKECTEIKNVQKRGKEDEEKEKEEEKEEQSPDIDYTDEAFDEALNNIPENTKNHILNGTKSSRKNTESGHAWETFFNGKNLNLMI